MDKEINYSQQDCPHQNGKGHTVYEKLEVGQLCGIASCPRDDCDKAKYRVAGSRGLTDTGLGVVGAKAIRRQLAILEDRDDFFLSLFGNLLLGSNVS